jgi:GNAT superfamily N-acetyltransferase
VLSIELAYGCEESIRSLFDEYTKLLVELDSGFENYLNMQGYSSEVSNLKEKYGLPKGRIYIAYLDGEAAGCIALKPFDDVNCEMKRLYVRARYRGFGIATLLAKTIIADAKQIGYQSMLLDTSPVLADAIFLYEKLGFYKIGKYNNNPLMDNIYMKLDLI